MVPASIRLTVTNATAEALAENPALVTLRVLHLGAGAITANFAHRPGQPKGRTTIGSNVRTGIHNGFVAPIEIGDGAWIAAGSVITKDVPADALAVARPRQETKEGYAARQRDV